MTSIKKEFPNVTEYYNEQGLLHRTDGPAREYVDGSKEWYINGIRHREDGPAIEWINFCKSWYLYGNYYSEDEWEQELSKIKLKRILDL